MKKVFFIALIITLFCQANAQNIFIKDSIYNLQTSVVINPDRSKQKILIINNSDISDIYLLPLYKSSRQIAANLVLDTAILKNVVYEKVDADLYKDVKWLEKLTSEAQLRSYIAVQRKQHIAEIELMPLRKNATTNEIEIVKYFECEVKFKPATKASISRNYASTSKLASGKWYKIKVAQSGMYKLTYSQLAEMGFSNFSSIGIFGYGGQQSKQIRDNSPLVYADKYVDDLPERPVYKVDANNNNRFDNGDYLLFYADGPHNIRYRTNGAASHDFHNYSDYSYYFVSDKGSWKQAQTVASELSANVQVSSYDKYRFLEKDSISIVSSGRNLFWRCFDYYLTMNESISEQNVLSDSATVFYHFVSASAVASNFELTVNGQRIGTLTIPGTTTKGLEANYQKRFVPRGNTTSFGVRYNKGTSTAKGWIDYIAMQFRKRLAVESGFVNFRDTRSVASGNVAEFTISQSPANLVVWDISDRCLAKQISGRYAAGEYKFIAKADTLCEYIAFNPQQDFTTPIYNNSDGVGVVTNQNLHSLGNADLVIITHPNFYSQAEAIKTLHERNDNMKVVIATPEKIYNEFSSGTPDICALRNFTKMFYDRASVGNLPKNLLLLGDGSFDNKTSDGSVSNFILTFQSENSITNTFSYTCDDFFVCFDEGEGEVAASDKMDMGVGRMPVKTVAEANAAVAKLQEYYSKASFGNWKNRATIIADDADNNEIVHQTNAENMIAKQLEFSAQYLNIEKIFLDDYEQMYSATGTSYPDVNKAVIDNFNNGTLLVTWVGHGNPKEWAHEIIFNFNSINSLQNKGKYPFVVTATCDYTPFDDHTFLSAGEQLYLAENAGAIAMLTTTREVYSTKNERLVTNVYKHLFKTHEEENAGQKPLTLGESVAFGKNTTSGLNMRCYVFLGDPAITLAQPDYQVKTTKINGIDAASFNDTIGATGLVHIEGQIYDSNGQADNSFNGTLFSTVYDKSNSYTTKGNDGYEPLTYTAQRNLIFNGKSTVKDGKFSFNFTVPVDIAYFYDKGKISYYASDNLSKEASGYDKQLVIGGHDENGLKDTEGPEIELYMNDEAFIDGGIVNENPLLLAKIRDASGVNTIGNGIGHDLTMMLDGNTTEKKVLNSFYEAEMDNYQAGSVKYPNSNISLGQHTLTLKAWDVMNNSSEKSIDFIVTTSSEMVIDKLFNYPNPFTTNTKFYFGHNQPYEQLEVLISIFTVSGKHVKTLESRMTCDGYLSEPIVWDGLDEYGDRIGKGVYVYKVRVRNSEGVVVEKIEKLVILR